MQLLLFTFSKRSNSTAAPADSAGTAVEVTLKQETSLNNPVFLLSGARPAASYAKFDGAYYFIDDVRSIRNNMYELVCRLDPLATYAAQIRATSAFVEFYRDGHTDIMDSRIVPLSPVTQAIGTGNIGFNQAGCYILSVVGKDGCVQYACSAAQLGAILASVDSWAAATLAAASDEFDALKIGFSQLISQGSALEAIRSCKWIPLSIADIPNTVTKRIYLGNYDTAIDAQAISTLLKTFGVSITVPFSRAGWRRLSPYTDVFIYLPFVGVVNINSPYWQANNELTINVSINVVSGEVAYSLMIDSVIIGTYGGNCGASIDFGTTITPALNIANGIISAGLTAGTVAAMGAFLPAGAAALGSIGAAGSVLSGAQAALMPTQNSVGGVQGGVGAGLVNNAVVYVLEHGTSGEIGNMANVQGLPYFNTATLGSLSGYVQTRGASVSGNIRGDVRDAINAALDSGIFLE